MLAALPKGKEADFRWKEQHKQSMNSTSWEERVLEEGGESWDWICRQGLRTNWEASPGLSCSNHPTVKVPAPSPGQGEARILCWL